MSDTVRLGEISTVLAALDQGVDDATRIDRIRALEELKSAAAAAQVRETAAFAASQRAVQVAAGIKSDRVGRGIAAQVGLAMRTSPFRAQRYVGWASILTTELPGTFAALTAGRTTEWRAMLVVRETAWLSREHRAVVDRELAPRLEGLGDRRVEAEAKTMAYRLDPAGAVAKVRGAESDRRVTLRPAPETMARLTGLLPVAQGVAAHVALTRAADTLVAAGDPRTRGQLMADLLVERLTGQASASDVAVEITLVMTPETLFNDDIGANTHGSNDSSGERSSRREAGDDDGCDDETRGDVGVGSGIRGGEPAHLDGYGPIPAGLARDLITGLSDTTPAWIRRLFTTPDGNSLAAMESRRRYFTPNQRHFIWLRDQTCRTPWCDAPIRHTDHVVSVAEGGSTSVANGQGCCQACNHAKQAMGWRARPDSDGMVETITPTGHRYRFRPPDPPGHRPPDPRGPSGIEPPLLGRLERLPARPSGTIIIDYDWHTAA